MTPYKLMNLILEAKGYSSINAAALAIESAGLSGKGAAQSALRRFITLQTPLRQNTMAVLCEFLGADPAIFASEAAATAAAVRLGFIKGDPSNIELITGDDKVPLISWVAAGAWCNVEDPYLVGDADEWLACPVRHGPRTYALRVVGLSMYNPTGDRSFKDGDIIFVDPDREALHKSFVIVRLDDESKATFKRLLVDGQQKMLEAINPSWPNRIMEVNNNASICGVVISKMESFI